MAYLYHSFISLLPLTRLNSKHLPFKAIKKWALGQKRCSTSYCIFCHHPLFLPELRFPQIYREPHFQPQKWTVSCRNVFNKSVENRSDKNPKIQTFFDSAIRGANHNSENTIFELKYIKKKCIIYESLFWNLNNLWKIVSSCKTESQQNSLWQFFSETITKNCCEVKQSFLVHPPNLPVTSKSSAQVQGENIQNSYFFASILYVSSCTP